MTLPTRIPYRALLIAIATATFGLACLGAARIGGRILSLRSHLLAVRAMADTVRAGQLEPAQVAGLAAGLHDAHADLAAVRAQVAPVLPLCQYLGWVPYVGGDIRAAPHLLEMALGTLKAAELAVDALGVVLPPAIQQTPPLTEQQLATMLEELLESRPDLLAARAQLDRADRARRMVDTHALSPLTAQLLQQTDAYGPLCQLGIDGALLAPELLAASRPRTFLILVQNEDELRATGGFISAVGLVRLDKGKILEMEFQDSYAIQAKAPTDPPKTLEMAMGAQVWLLRDANWSPHFPDVARLAADMYKRDQNVEVDGVIAVDQEAVRALVRAMGSVNVGEWDDPLTGDNVVTAIRQAWAPDPGGDNSGWWAHRKDFMGEIAEAMLQQLGSDIEPQVILRIATALKYSLSERHILLYLNDQPAAGIIADNRWDGSLLPTEGDYLMVVDSNVGFNKADANMEQSVDYHVRIRDDGRLESTLTLSYRNNSARPVDECVQEARYDATYEGMIDRCYWDYLRVYVPRGAQLLEAAPPPPPARSIYQQTIGGGQSDSQPRLPQSEKDRDTLEAFFVVPPRQSRQVQFTYELPALVQSEGRDRRYSLLIQKQPGTSNRPVNVYVELPPLLRPRSATPTPDAESGSTLEFHFALATDQLLELVLR